MPWFLRLLMVVAAVAAVPDYLPAKGGPPSGPGYKAAPPPRGDYGGSGGGGCNTQVVAHKTHTVHREPYSCIPTVTTTTDWKTKTKVLAETRVTEYSYYMTYTTTTDTRTVRTTHYTYSTLHWENIITDYSFKPTYSLTTTTYPVDVLTTTKVAYPVTDYKYKTIWKQAPCTTGYGYTPKPPSYPTPFYPVPKGSPPQF